MQIRSVDNYRDFQVDRNNFTNTRWVKRRPLGEEDLESGQLLVAVERFAFTANNISYAVTGESLGYWNFFPAPEGWGRVPVWGFAEVTATRAPGIEPGERIYGFFPTSNQLIMVPAKLDETGFFDSTLERKAVSSVYDYYRRRGMAPTTNADRDDRVALFQPLLITAFLLDDHLAEQDYRGAERIVVTSASSKTALCFAHLLRARRGDGGSPELMGATSTGNRKFVESTGYYDAAVGYKDLDTLSPDSRTLVVDFAGNPKLKNRLREHLSRLEGIVTVGATHHSEADPNLEPAEDETFFFAPSHSKVRVNEWGREEFDRRYEEAARNFYRTTEHWLRLDRRPAVGDLESEFLDVLTGSNNPADGLIFLF